MRDPPLMLLRAGDVADRLGWSEREVWEREDLRALIEWVTGRPYWRAWTFETWADVRALPEITPRV